MGFGLLFSSEFFKEITGILSRTSSPPWESTFFKSDLTLFSLISFTLDSPIGDSFSFFIISSFEAFSKDLWRGYKLFLFDFEDLLSIS